MKNNVLVTWYRRQGHLKLFLVCLSMLTSGILGLLPQTSFAASPGPQVLIAVDTTPSNCTWTIVKVPDNHRLPRSTRYVACAPGTMVSTKPVSLSQAMTMHEAYVLLPATSTSPIVQKERSAVVQNMIQIKRQTLQAGLQKALVPNRDCGETLYGSAPTTIFGNRVFMKVTWHIAASCGSLVVDTMELDGLNVINNMWWYQYAYGDYGVRCPPDYSVQNGGSYSVHPNMTGPIGYDAVWSLGAVQDPCAYAMDGSTIAYGPLN